MRPILLMLITIMLLCCSCGNRTVYTEFYSLSTEGWHQDSAMTYTVAIDDSTASYDLLLVVRHTTQYPYQNLWLFVDEYMGNMLVHQDTIEAMMADDYGRWLGSGVNRYELPLLYDAQRRFNYSGEYTFRVQQGMRTDWLKGITDVGLVVER